jgi:hypothetical protein
VGAGHPPDERYTGPAIHGASRAAGGGHQIFNGTRETVRFLAFSTNGEPDIVIHPDSGKVGASQRLPDGGGLRAIFRQDSAADYYDGEQPPGA